MKNTGLALSMGLAPYEQDMESKAWLEEAEHGMTVSQYYTRNRQRFATQTSEGKCHPKLRKIELSYLHMDSVTIDVMNKQIQTLKDANITLTDIYTTLKTLALTGVIEQCVNSVSGSIDELEVRGVFLKDMNTFDIRFSALHGGFFNIQSLLEYVYNYRKCRHLYHYFDRLDFIKFQESLVDKEWTRTVDLKKHDGKKFD
eukprot:UN33544